jgi:hypothetical protein
MFFPEGRRALPLPQSFALEIGFRFILSQAEGLPLPTPRIRRKADARSSNPALIISAPHGRWTSRGFKCST